MRVVISFILTTTFLFCGYSHNIHRPNNDHVLAGSAAKITFYQQDDQRQQQSSSSSSGSSSSSSLSSSSAGSSSSTPNRMVQSQPSSSATGQRLTRVGGFDEVFRWRQISFTPLENDKRFNDLTATEIRDNFIQYNNFPMGMMHHKGRLFITLPRRRPGMPATVAFIVANGSRGSSPSLQAYPDFRTNQLHPQNQPDRNRIISVYRSRVDKCDRLWFVDTGNLEYPGASIQVQPASIWVFDLNTDTLVRRAEMPTANVVDGHGIASLTVDIDDNCDDAYAYLPDLVNYRLHVYSFRANQFWTFTHNFFGYDPLRGDFNVAGATYQWNDGIFSVTLSERNAEGVKTAYFHAMASTSEFAVSTAVLKNQTASTRSNHGTDFRYLGQRSERGQSAMHAYDKFTGLIFYSQVSLNGVGCWDTTQPLTPDNFHLIAQDNTTMIYPSDINIDEDGVIWVMTNNLPLYNYATVDPNEYNYRIWRAPIQQAIEGTPCGENLKLSNFFGFNVDSNQNPNRNQNQNQNPNRNQNQNQNRNQNQNQNQNQNPNRNQNQNLNLNQSPNSNLNQNFNRNRNPNTNHYPYRS